MQWHFLWIAAAGLVGGIGCTSGGHSIVQSTDHGVTASGPIPTRRVVPQMVATHAYKGWPHAFLLSNGRVWAAVVPAVGRVMQFGLVNEDGVFWENPKLLGQSMPANPWDTTGSFGGDKTWPAPQSVWNWPPPDVFDREPVSARVEGSSVVLNSAVSPRFGIRTERRIELEASEPVMKITTTYFKMQGEPVDVGVWVITQAKNPQAMYLPIPADSKFPGGYSQQWGMPTNFIAREPGRLRFNRDPLVSHKIGNDADHLIWEDRRLRLTLTTARIRGATYPDDGCSVEIYTNGGSVDYVELETLGPTRRLSIGDQLSATNRYRLERR